MIKPWHVALSTPIISFGGWVFMLSQVPTWNAIQPVHIAGTIGFFVVGVGVPFLIMVGTNHRDHW
jgi:hypothetical protein